MSAGKPIRNLATQRRLGFLKTFDKKLEGLRRENERLHRLVENPRALGGAAALAGLERIVRGLVGAGPVYGLPEITAWAEEALEQVQALKEAGGVSGAASLSWIATAIVDLGSLRDEALAAIDSGVDAAAPPPKPKTVSKMAFTVETSPPPPPVPSVEVARAEEKDAAQETASSSAEEKDAAQETASSSAEEKDAAQETASSSPEERPASRVSPEATPPSAPELPLEEGAGGRSPAAASDASSVAESPPLPAKPAAPPAPPPAALKQSLNAAPPPHVPPQGDSSVLVLSSDPGLRRAAENALTLGGFSTIPFETPDSAYDLLTRDLPDLFVVDLDDPPPAGGAFIAQLSRDPLTDFIPVITVGTRDDAIRADFLSKPLDPRQLLQTATRLAGPEASLRQTNSTLKDTNLRGLVDFVTEELRTGILGAATGSQDSIRFQVADEGALMAAIWNLVGRLRRVAVASTLGNIRFVPATRDDIGMLGLDELGDVLDPGAASAVEEDVAALSGIEVVLAEDDESVRGAFAETFEAVGMRVRAFDNGAAVLEAVRESIPDVLVTDILMPEMDGWELATRMKRDYSLRHVPVIMLSWKEDFLDRVRQLDADAASYLLKETDREQIIRRIARVLRPRIALQKKLSGPKRISGRIERLGLLTVLAEVARAREDCRLSVREGWSFFEVDIAGGEVVAVTRTGTDGSFDSGSRALERLLAATAGRFTVGPPADHVRTQLESETWSAVREAAGRLNELVSRVVDGALIHIESVDLDREVLALYSEVCPPAFGEPLKLLADGQPPREIILGATASSGRLEILLLDLIHTGAVRAITVGPRTSSTPPPAWDPASLEALADPRRGPIMGARRDGDNTETVPISMSDIVTVDPGSPQIGRAHV
jgi:CheY-like chemotaxis protein